jgi:uncharacterized protein YndB with AHSA1/START domain
MSDTTAPKKTPPREVSVSQSINASPERVWQLVSDITRMGEWSPETTSCSWIKGATGPAVGAKFTGDNTNGKKKWSTTCVVSKCEPGKSFVFDVNVGPLKISRWAYEITAGDGSDACTVTETWTDRRGGLVTMLGKPLSGVGDRSAHNRDGMVATLATLAAKASQA